MDTSLATAVHLVQTALTPVFLLSGIAALLGVFATRQARLSDRAELLARGRAAASADELARMTGEVDVLRRRSHVLDLAVGCGALAAGSTALSILVLFLSALRASVTAGLLVDFFGAAIVLTIAAVVFFILELFLGSRSLRARSHFHFPLPHLRARETDPAAS